MNDSSITNTIRWPRSFKTFAIATQLFVGPQAPGSGKNAIVLRSVNATPCRSVTGTYRARVRPRISAQTERTLLVVQPGLKSGRPSPASDTVAGSTPSSPANPAASRFHASRSHDSATSRIVPSDPTATAVGADTIP